MSDDHVEVVRSYHSAPTVLSQVFSRFGFWTQRYPENVRALGYSTDLNTPVAVSCYISQMREVNRSAMMVTLKQPFLDWLVSVDAKDRRLGIDDLNREPVICLIPECESDDEFQEWLKRNYRAVFEEHLDSWWTDQSLWPKTRTFDVFQGWFDCRLYSVVLDAGSGRLSTV